MVTHSHCQCYCPRSRSLLVVFSHGRSNLVLPRRQNWSVGDRNMLTNAHNIFMLTIFKSTAVIAHSYMLAIVLDVFYLHKLQCLYSLPKQNGAGRWEIIQNWCLYSISSLIYSSWFNHSSKTMFFWSERSICCHDWATNLGYILLVWSQHLHWTFTIENVYCADSTREAWRHEVTGQVVVHECL